MKVLKFLAVPIFITAVFFSCKKTENNTNINEAVAEQVTIKNGVVTFATTAAYLKITENKNDEQQKLKDQLKTSSFSGLLNKKEELLAPAAAVANSINVITASFNPALYSTYLLSILNQDKICSIDGFFVKVDMDNGFCSAIDATVNPNG